MNNLNLNVSVGMIQSKLHLRFESHKDHIPGEIEVPYVLLVPFEQFGFIITDDVQVFHFSGPDFRKEEVLDPLEDGVEEKPDDVKDDPEPCRHF